ncbi:NAD(P)-dependent alcohol dehydrogenase [Croceimicrobium hydrocarbonivorans]|uniref:NAD(P)-dependent alcohol dehydrogenase n=1 Tax=Croceimicrobium hydrocarbonivorans TaxID=2761580 RepID=A0A7H0VEY4_9FLAO|nr:NAD(P)-dependent alcohol dehydrogenase [Croceimicrobium hydrocarbonivorans]QNR24282.1 NAD(P)-dependent alcohol dehydrogenase [Croceimicrobium hydrocarbonivorans]
MKVVSYHQYGPPEVLKIEDRPKPIPKDNEVLVRVYATTVTSGDTRLRSSNFPGIAWLIVRLVYGLFTPKKKVLGHEFAGVVEAVGKEVRKFAPGDEVLGTPTGLETGSYAEYLSIPENRSKGVLGLKPKSLDFNEAAALPVGGMTALYLLQKAAIQKGQKVLIYGASGSVGSIALQIAKAKGAIVTAVCSSTNFEMVQSLGADELIDYKSQDYSMLGTQYDIVLDAVGKSSKTKAKKILKKEGQFVSVAGITKPKQEHLDALCRLAKEGKIKPYLSKVYPLNQIVAAHEYVDLGHKKGNIAIDMKP